MTTMKRFAAVALTVLAGWTPLPAQAQEAPEGAPAVIARFLGLRPDQQSFLEQALGERQQTVVPLLQGIAMREQRIRELVASGGDPAEIGVLVGQIHQLRGQAEVAQAVFLARVESVLDAEQRVRWEHVRVAARLQPVLAAFQALQLL